MPAIIWPDATWKSNILHDGHANPFGAWLPEARDVAQNGAQFARRSTMSRTGSGNGGMWVFRIMQLTE